MAAGVTPYAQLLDDAVTLTRRRPFAVPLAVAAPLAFVNAGWAALSSWFATGAAESADPALLFGAIGAFLLALPAFMVLQLFAYSVLAVAATRRVLGASTGHGAEAGRGAEPRLWETVRFVFKPRVLLTLLLAAVLLMLSLFALIFPFFVVSALLSFLFPVMLDEQRFGTEAVSRSASLAWRNPRGLLQSWPLVLILGIHAVYFAVSTGLSLAIQAPVQVIQQAVMFRQTLGTGMIDPGSISTIVWLQVPLGVITTFTSILAAWYLFHCMALFFLDTRERREATSVERAVAAWPSGARATPAPPPLPPRPEPLG
jgi:hypothetical protein